MYLLKPAVFVGLSLYWIATGLIALGPGHRAALELLHSAGLPGAAAIIAGAAADILIGVGIGFRRTARAALRAGLALSLFYLTIGSAILPGLWFDPLGPFLKVLPLILLMVAALAILEER